MLLRFTFKQSSQPIVTSYKQFIPFARKEQFPRLGQPVIEPDNSSRIVFIYAPNPNPFIESKLSVSREIFILSLL